jgi:hypothetical protein
VDEAFNSTCASAWQTGAYVSIGTPPQQPGTRSRECVQKQTRDHLLTKSAAVRNTSPQGRGNCLVLCIYVSMYDEKMKRTLRLTEYTAIAIITSQHHIEADLESHSWVSIRGIDILRDICEINIQSASWCEIVRPSVPITLTWPQLPQTFIEVLLHQPLVEPAMARQQISSYGRSGNRSPTFVPMIEHGHTLGSECRNRASQYRPIRRILIGGWTNFWGFTRKVSIPVNTVVRHIGWILCPCAFDWDAQPIIQYTPKPSTEASTSQIQSTLQRDAGIASNFI